MDNQHSSLRHHAATKVYTSRWSRCSNGIRLTCVVGSAPLMSMMRKLWRRSVASLQPTTKMKFPNNDIDSIDRPSQTRSMWRCNINSLRHIVTLPPRWPQNKYSSLGCMQKIQLSVTALHFTRPISPIDGPVHILSIWSSPQEIKCPCQIDTHSNPITMRWGGNVYAAAIIRRPTPQRAISTASYKHTLRWGHQTTHVNNWRNYTSVSYQLFAHSGHRSGRKGKVVALFSKRTPAAKYASSMTDILLHCVKSINAVVGRHRR